ncbi:glycoside hydrolase family 19 protein [Pseudomonas qingdaonensis]|jgi:putative chitinase|nr:glycoside hydrolase family 19 protein [Pseudomonas qingdaonensis]
MAAKSLPKRSAYADHRAAVAADPSQCPPGSGHFFACSKPGNGSLQDQQPAAHRGVPCPSRSRTGHLRSLVENLNYSADALARTWPTRFTALSSAAYARQPEKIANKVYADRMANGPESSGDGWRYRGRGLIQLTGRSNYRAAADELGLPLVDKPKLLEQPEFACQSAAWWWSQNRLNELADAGKFEAITRKINGGLNGQADRVALYERALKVLA